jgi:Zn-dependent protease with chaperone function
MAARWTRCWLVAAGVLVLGCGCSAFSPEQYKYTRSVVSAIRSSNIGLPPHVYGKGEAHVVIAAGGGYTRVSLISWQMPGYALSNVLTRAGREAGFKLRPDIGPVWDGQYYVVDSVAANPKRGRSLAVNDVQVGRLVAALKAQGIKPYVVIAVPDYALASISGLPQEKRIESTWYNATSVPADFRVSVRSQMPSGLFALIVCLKFALPAISLLVCLIGFGVGQSRRCSARMRVIAYDWLAAAVPMMSGLGGMFVLFAFFNSTFVPLVNDVVLGRDSGDYVLIEAMIGLAVSLLVLPIVALVFRSRVLRGLDEEPEILDLGMLQKKALTRAGVIVEAGAAVAAGALLTGAVHWKPWDSSRPGSAFVPLLMSWLPLWLTNRMMWGPSKPDAGLTKRVQEIGEKFGIRIRQARISKSSMMGINACAQIGKGVITVSQDALETLAPAELDWLLAHEVAHFLDRAIYRRIFLPITIGGLSTILVCGLFAARVVQIDSLLLLWISGLFVPAWLIVVFDVHAVRHRLEYEADLQALRTTGDLDAAVSALRTMAGHSKSPGKGEVELDEHPKVSKRIKALRAEAQKILPCS